ncbi:helix-turn-helix domain-containing protein [Actinoallomurus liliacearum]|uniref:Helix-turn-helix domain-containing protein n=1 Tax=Actinoallomurus liliacearum TaxID=1080073 RepID=A0ABP8TR19_9ACTN
MREPAGRGLGDFLRSRRERLSPETVGLPERRRRRTPGLRREEVAELAGIGIDWYVRLEQGRAGSPSTTTIDALAEALRLDATDRDHLRRLACSPAREPFVREQVSEGTRRLVEGLGAPAYVTGRRWDVLAWNAEAARLFTDFGRLGADDRNVLVYLLLTPEARRLFGDGWTDQARHATAQFRAAHDLWAPDPAFTALADRLRRGCPEFATWWERHDVLPAGSGRKRLHHPSEGPLVFEYATFQSNEDPALRLTVYSPADHTGSRPPVVF